MIPNKTYTGTLLIISAPSGAGKTSLIKALRTRVNRLSVSVSHTTRAIRPGEAHGKDYFFVTPSEFTCMVEQGAFLEHAEVFGNFYGTARQTVENMLMAGDDVILEVDWQGARQVRSLMPEARSIFILPPSKAILESRLKTRGQDDEATIQRRMADARSEMSHYSEYDFLVINDDFDEALAALEGIVKADRQSMKVQCRRHEALIEALLV